MEHHPRCGLVGVQLSRIQAAFAMSRILTRGKGSPGYLGLLGYRILVEKLVLFNAGPNSTFK